jgi:hypothetical protein
MPSTYSNHDIYLTIIGIFNLAGDVLSILLYLIW